MIGSVPKKYYDKTNGVYVTLEPVAEELPDIVEENVREMVDLPSKPQETKRDYLDLEFEGFKYNEDQFLRDMYDHLRTTYGEHYVADDSGVECFDAWIALGDSGPTFRNTALKYLWRYGKKGGKNKADLLKAVHYIQMLMHVEHYKGK